MEEINNSLNTIIVWYARPKSDYFPSEHDYSEDWMVDSANQYSKNGYLDDRGLDCVLEEEEGLPWQQVKKVFQLAKTHDIELRMSEGIWGSRLKSRPARTCTQAFNALNADLIANNIPVKFVCKWTF